MRQAKDVSVVPIQQNQDARVDRNVRLIPSQQITENSRLN